MTVPLKYRREIDGLRAIAVLSVVIFHADPTILPGGFLGVDIFFVISGYLITSILLKEIDNGDFTFSRFYERRVRRIFPALLIVLLFSTLAAWQIMTPAQFKDYSQSILATSTFTSNIYFFLKTGYFDQSSHVLPLLHTWSLSVEEQFYILFPILLLVLTHVSIRTRLAAIWLLFCISIIVGELWSSAAPEMGFFMLPARGWELLSGALLAINSKELNAWLGRHGFLRNIFELSGATAVLTSILLLNPSTPMPGVFALPVVLGTTLIIFASNQTTPIGQILATRLLVGIGLISYSAYLWHQPIFAFARLHFGHLEPATLGPLFAATFIAAYLSWYFVEQTFRDKNFMSQTSVLIGGGLMILTLSTFGVVGHFKKGFENRYDASTRVLAQTAKISPRRKTCHTDGIDFIIPSDACVYGNSDPTWAVFGDSHGVEIAYVAGKLLAPLDQSVKHLTFSGCPPISAVEVQNPGCSSWTRLATEFIEKSHEIRNVIIVYRHGFHLYGEHGRHGNNYDEMMRSAPSFDIGLDSDETRDAYWNALDSIVSRFTAAGKNVLVFSSIPELPTHIGNIIFDEREPLENRLNAQWESTEFLNARYTDINQRLSELTMPGAKIVHVANALCDHEHCSAIVNGKALYFDDNHLSLFGSELLLTSLLKSRVIEFGRNAQ